MIQFIVLLLSCTCLTEAKNILQKIVQKVYERNDKYNRWQKVIVAVETLSWNSCLHLKNSW